MRNSVLEVVAATPRGGGYEWPPKTDGAGGCLEDIIHDGGIVLRAAEPPTTYCSGLTLEIWFESWTQQGRVPPITFAEARELQRIWFITKPEYRKGPVEALTRFGLGIETTDDPKPGDFAQVWRGNGSGHTVVVLDYDGRRNKLRYFSTQRSTNGPGERTEYVSELYTVRPVSKKRTTRA